MKISSLNFEIKKQIKNNQLIYYRDFIIDSVSLKTILEKKIGAFDGISPIGFYNDESTYKYLNTLMLNEKPELENGRISIYVCSECGDLGCGAYTVQINKVDDFIIWGNFGFENNYENKQSFLKDLEWIQIKFDYAEYMKVIREVSKLYQ